MKKLLFILVIFLSIKEALAQTKTKINTDESQVTWTGSNLFQLGKHFGIVKFESGQLHLNADTLIGGQFLIDMHTITNTDGKYNKMLVDHLKNEDFFDVNRFSQSKLNITHVKYLSDSTLSINADLTIKGITNPIEFQSTVKQVETELLFTSKFIIDRAKWKIKYGSRSFFSDLGDDIISDAIRFDVVVKTIK